MYHSATVLCSTTLVPCTLKQKKTITTLIFFILIFSALSLKPGDALVLKRRADVLGKQGKRDAAIADYKQAIEIQALKQVTK